MASQACRTAAARLTSGVRTKMLAQMKPPDRDMPLPMAAAAPWSWEVPTLVVAAGRSRAIIITRAMLALTSIGSS